MWMPLEFIMRCVWWCSKATKATLATSAAKDDREKRRRSRIRVLSIAENQRESLIIIQTPVDKKQQPATATHEKQRKLECRSR
uniref:Secreted protein n=1 Tax=Kalanchoe fedtschenkoi TaxID=63787 RepID=A0A7N0UDI8_KALFE